MRLLTAALITKNKLISHGRMKIALKELKGKTLSPRELDVLNILAGAPQSTSTEISNIKHSLTQSTVIAVLRKMLSQNYVKVCGVTHAGKVLTRQYMITPAGRQAVIQHFLTELESVKNIITIDDVRDAAAKQS